MLALFHAGDATGALACFSDDVYTDASRRPDGPTGRGREELARIVADWMGTWEDWEEEIHEIQDLGEVVVVVATQRGRGRGSGIQIEQRYATVYRLRGSEIASMTLYTSAEEALEFARSSRGSGP